MPNVVKISAKLTPCKI